MIKLAINGAGGRMGRKLMAFAKESGNFELVAALDCAEGGLLGQDAGVLAGIGPSGVALTDTITGSKPEVMIDFSLPAGTRKWIPYCADNQIPVVIGTTGLDDADIEMLKKAAEKIPVLLGANMSLGVNLLFKLVGQVARSLGPDYDIEIVEAHHRFKKDAPSGTSLELGRQIAAATDRPWPGCLDHGREGRDALRQSGQIGMHAVRAGDIVGEHTVLYSALGETVEIRHRAHSRDTFTRGALRAAQWLAGKQPGYYNMADVLGL